MSENGFQRDSSEWLNNDNFKKFLEEYIEADSYASGTNEDLRAYITYRMLYKIYTNSLKTNNASESLHKEFSKIFETLERAESETVTLNELIIEQKESQKITQIEKIIHLTISVIAFILSVFSFFILTK